MPHLSFGLAHKFRRPWLPLSVRRSTIASAWITGRSFSTGSFVLDAQQLAAGEKLAGAEAIRVRA
jgi:hypothetical protein